MPATLQHPAGVPYRMENIKAEIAINAYLSMKYGSIVIARTNLFFYESWCLVTIGILDEE